MGLKDAAKEAAETFAEAIKEQAEKYGVPRSALARYVAASAKNKLDELGLEVEAVQGLLDLK